MHSRPKQDRPWQRRLKAAWYRLRQLVSNMLWWIGNASWLQRRSDKPLRLDPADTLIVHMPNHLGDNIMSIPLVRSLVGGGYNNVVLVCLKKYEALWRQQPGLASVLTINGWLSQTAEERSRVKQQIIDVKARCAILLAPGFDLALMYARTGIAYRIGYDYWGRGMLLTHRLRSYGPPTHHTLVSRHYAQNTLEILSLLGMPTAPVGIEAPLRAWTQGSRSIAHEPDQAPPAVAICVSGNSPDKTIPNALLQKIINQGFPDEWQIILLGLECHREQAAALGEAIGRPVLNKCGETDLEELVDLLQSSRLLISPDTGLSHLGAALSVPTIVLFGSGSPVWTRPLGSRVRCVRTKARCSPCFNALPCRNGYVCRDSFPETEVLMAIGEFTHPVPELSPHP